MVWVVGNNSIAPMTMIASGDMPHSYVFTRESDTDQYGYKPPPWVDVCRKALLA